MTSGGRNQLVEEALRGARGGAGAWIRVTCPFCPEVLGKVDRSQAMSVSASTGWWECHRCGTKGKLREAPNPAEVQVKPDPGAMKAPPGYYPLFDEDGRRSLSLAPARDYLEGRGGSPQKVAAARIGACLDGRFADRVVVPVFAPDGESWTGFVTRTWHKGVTPTYLNAKGMERRTLYNHVALFKQTDEPVLVVEGVFDAIALWPDAVAVLGKPTESQIAAMVASPRPVVALLDGDAWRESWALCQRLRLTPGKRAGWVKLGPGLDPDELPAEQIRSEARASLDKV
jgi:hypothetical protein